MHSDYAPVDGMKMYYEIHGTGKPLVLVHGGVVGIRMFGGNVDALGQSRKVIAVALQGHGHTRDIDRPLSFEALSDDGFALIKHLGFSVLASWDTHWAAEWRCRLRYGIRKSSGNWW